MSSHQPATSGSTEGETNRLLSVEGLETVFQTDEGVVRAVDGVNFHLDEGEIVGLVGESGAGKSVTARSIIRLIDSPGRITNGDITFDGLDVMGMSEEELRRFRGNRTGMVFQDPTGTLNPTMRVGRQVAETIEVYGDVAGDEVKKRAVDILERVGIPNAQARFDDYPHEFSGGQKQRIGFGIAIASQPDLLFADEPTTALDVTIQAQILDLLDELRSDLGMSVLFITHDLGIVREICDRVLVMYAGSIVESGEVESVFTDPRHPYTKGLLASNPGLDEDDGPGANPANQRDRLDVIPGTMPDLTGEFDGCKYADRCPGAEPECREAHPPLEEAKVNRGERLVACYRHEEIDDIDYSYVHEPRSLSWRRTRDRSSGNGTLLSGTGLKKHFTRGGTISRLLGTEEVIRAVDGINFEIDAGRTLGLVGESGCGKSTAARAILQLLEPTDGTVVYRGQNLTEADKQELREARRNLQIVFQNPQSSLNPRRSIGRILRRPMKLHGIGDADERADRAQELITEVGLDVRHLERLPGELSGGQQQRVAIARALAVNPEVIILDEPVSGLDVSIQAQILNLLEDLQDNLGLSYLFISHNLSVVEHVCDRVAVMYLGEIVEHGTVKEVFNPPFHPYTEALLSAVPGQTDVSDRIVLEGDVPDPSNVPDGCRFHPRCPRYIGEICEVEKPTSHEAAEDHRIQCHLLGDEYQDTIDWHSSVH